MYQPIDCNVKHRTLQSINFPNIYAYRMFECSNARPAYKKLKGFDEIKFETFRTSISCGMHAFSIENT